jgi:thimet oligopeptidase
MERQSMKRFLVLTAALAATGALAASRPLIPVLDVAALNASCDAGLDKARAAMAAMEAKQGGAGVFDEWNRLLIDLEATANPIDLLGNVSPDKAVREAAEPCLQKLTTFSTDLFQNEKLYRRIAAARPAGAHQAKLRKDLIESFEDTGVTLPPAKRARMKAILDQLEVLRQNFDKNIRDDPTRVVMSPEEMAGLPDSYLISQKKDDKGNFVLGLDYPAYFPFLKNARSGEARRRYWIAKQREGGKDNLAILDEAMSLRYELAGLYGLKSYAQYALRRKMAGTPARVDKFLAEVKGAITALEKQEIAELTALKAGELGKPVAQVKLERWDVSYYQEKLRQARFAIDQEALRKYFPTDKAIAFALKVASDLYGVRFERVAVPVWDKDVQYYDVSDAASGRFIAGLYLDPYPREGKYNHAAHFGAYGVSTREGRTPVSALVTNFDRKGLDHGELETLLHEFGHALHNLLSKAEYNPHAGTSVKRDFVEAPSQMFEEWARRGQTLALMKSVCPECPLLTADEIRRLDEARKYGMGLRYAGQWSLAAFDMALVGGRPRPSLEAWKDIASRMPLGYVEGTMFPASFGHLMGGYAAGYYGYMWSEVMALDMLSAFGGNLMDPKVGARYREAILEQGGQVEPGAMVRKFLGREPDSKAFFSEITGRR